MSKDKIYKELINYTLRTKDKLPSECSVQDIVEGVLEAVQKRGY